AELSKYNTCNLAYQNFFWKGCMPGADGNLCKVCIGGTSATVMAVSDNFSFSSYTRCLVGNPSGRSFGDVAFLEHSNLLWNIENLESSGWAKGYTAADFELLCPDGTRAAVTEWAACNLGSIPPNTVMTRPVTKLTLPIDLLFKDATQSLVPATHMSYREILGEPFFQLAESVFNCTPAGKVKFFILN
uniref:Transferrin-like domain-containing protein n=1 Tax=Coturnix japonica TaxID=93934 RepID=A0A8C2TMX3_COTJA